MNGLYPIIRRKRRPLLAEAEVAQPAAVPGPVGQGADAGAAGMGEGPAAVGVPLGVEAGETGTTVPAVGAVVPKPKRSHHKKKVVVEPVQPRSVTAV